MRRREMLEAKLIYDIHDDGNNDDSVDFDDD